MATRPNKTRTWYKQRCISLAKAEVRKRGACERCGMNRMQVQLQGAHVIPEGYEGTCADTENILCLCARCHRLGKDSWHQNPMLNARWFDQKFPGRYEELLQKSTRDIEWHILYDELMLEDKNETQRT